MSDPVKATEQDLVAGIEYQLGKSLDEAVYEAVADVVERSREADEVPLEKGTNANGDPFDEAIALPSGRIAVVTWALKVIEKEELCIEKEEL